MRSYLHELLKDAAALGFEFVGYNGSNHLVFHNATTGQRCSTAFSPSDYRSRRNSIAQMERLSGRKLPRPNNGKHKYRRQTQLDTTLTPAEQRASERVAALLEEAASVRRRIEYLAAEPTRDAAAETRRAITKYEHLRRRLEQLHRIIPQIEAPHHE
jgi:hypothetical protein